jgi:phage tail-like protein
MMRKILQGWQFSKVRTSEITDIAEIGSQIPLLLEETTLPLGTTIPRIEVQINYVNVGGQLSFVISKTIADNPQITTDSLLVKFGIPRNTDTFTFTGKVAILSSEIEYPRAYDLNKYKLEFEGIINSHDVFRDEYITTLIIQGTVGVTKYITLLYEVNLVGFITSPFFIYSQVNCLNSGIPNKLYEPLDSKLGLKLFNKIPAYLKKEDEKNGNATKKILNILGRTLDDLETKVNQLKNSYNPNTVSADKLPYIDNLLGWETNFELSEQIRRFETNLAIDVYKTKSTTRSIELILQEILGWNVEIQEGYPFVFSLNQTPYELLSKPIDWNDNTDGNWEELKANSPISTTYNLDMGQINIGSTFSPIAILPSFTDMKDVSSNNFQNLNGVLIKLYPLPNRKVKLGRDLLDKLNSLLPQLLVHYADYFISIQDVFDETFALGITDQFDDFLGYINGETLGLKSKSGTLTPETSMVLFETWGGAYDSLLNDRLYRLFHNAMGITGSEVSGGYLPNE